MESESKKSDDDEMQSIFQEPDDIFKCIMCGDCCTGFGGTYITDDDIERISNFIHCNKEQFISQFCSKSGTKYVLGQNPESGKCIFFDHEKQCSIHLVKPAMCRNWPFIEAVAKHPENWNIMADSCPGMKKNIPYKIIINIAAKEIKKQKARLRSGLG